MMNSAPQPHILRLRVPTYLILGVALLFPLIDVMMGAWPMHPGLLTWRFGFVGILATTVSAPLLVLLLLYAFALSVGDRKVVVLCAVVALVLAVVLVAGGASFFLDTIQMKRRVPASQLARFDAASTQALMKLAINTIASLVLGISILRTLRMARVVPGEKETRQGSLLVGVKSDNKRPSTQAAADAAYEAGIPDAAPAPVEAAPAERSPAMETPARGVPGVGELPARTAPKSAARPPSVGMMPPPPPRKTE